MNSYWVSFVIGDSESPESYTRRQSIYDVVDALDPSAWKQTTSYLLFKTEKTHDQVARDLISKLIDGLDVLVVGEVGSQDAYVFGMADLSINNYLDTKPLRKP